VVFNSKVPELRKERDKLRPSKYSGHICLSKKG